MSKPLAKIQSGVTVIIPCFNDGLYILRALDSVLNQTLAPTEIIIVDDGSSEPTLKVLQGIQHELVDIIYQKNQGVSVARNNGIRCAKTEYILTLDADDFLEKTFIAKAFSILSDNNNERVGAVGCYVNILKNDVLDFEVKKPLGGNVKDFLWTNNATSCSLFRKECWTEVGGYDEKMINGYEDWEFWIAITSREWKVSIIKEPLFTYRKKKVSRDVVARNEHDFELRKYIFLKHKIIYNKYFEFFCVQLLFKNSSLRAENVKVKNGIENRLGTFLLKPLKLLKKNKI